jgi:hypothetical protein
MRQILATCSTYLVEKHWVVLCDGMSCFRRQYAACFGKLSQLPRGEASRYNYSFVFEESGGIIYIYRHTYYLHIHYLQLKSAGMEVGVCVLTLFVSLHIFLLLAQFRKYDLL